MIPAVVRNNNPGARRSLLSVDGLDRVQIDSILARATSLKAMRSVDRPSSLSGRIVALLFFQPSTRTRFSFEVATLRLGGHVIGFDSPEGTRAGSNWRESLADTARVLSGYVDAVVIRHSEVAAIQTYAENSSVPVINAGNGSGVGSEHPTQSLLDLFTIREAFGTLDGLKVLLVGGMALRTVRSFMKTMQHYPSTEIFLYPASGHGVPSADIEHYNEIGVNYRVVATPDALLTGTDVVYHHGLTEDRNAPIEDAIMFNRQRLSDLPDQAIVLHSLPRADELGVDVDSMPQARYFEQAHNGVPIRMAVLEHLLAS